jgi:penicillin amidase
LFAPRDHGAVDGDNECVFTTGFVPHVFGTHPSYASIARYVFDVSDWEASTWIVFHGTAGDAGSPHYDDQSQRWRRGETVPMAYGWDTVAAGAASHTVFTPT